MEIEVPTTAEERLVVVVGVDLSAISEHLLRTARRLIATAGEAELHVVHVVQPDALPLHLAGPVLTTDVDALARAERAKQELARLCTVITAGLNAHVFLYTLIGDAAEELTRVARSVKADIVVVEAHDRSGVSRLFHRSVVARITRVAPCSVLTIRRRHEEAPAAQAHAV